MLDYERQHPEGEFLWRSRGGIGQHGVGAPGIYDAVGLQVSDPVSALLSGLARNPHAAQRFLLSGGQEDVTLGDQEMRVSSRLKYLIENREWEFDRAPGRAFSQLLEAATMTMRDREVTGLQSAQLATQTIALIGAYTGHDSHGAIPLVRPSSPGWQLPESLRPIIAEMLASYAVDLQEAVISPELSRLSSGATLDYRALTDGTSDLLYGDGLPYGAVFDQDLLAPLLQTLGQDKKNFDVVLAGMAFASNLRLSTALDQTLAIHPNAAADLITGRVVPPRIATTLIGTSSALSWVIGKGLTGAENDHALEQERAKALADTLALASNLPFIPKVSDNATVQYLFKQGLSAAIKEAGQVSSSEVVQQFEALDQDVPQAAVDNVLTLLMQSGYLTPEAFDAANQYAGAPVYVAPPGADRDPPVLDTTSEEYRRWLDNYGPLDLLQNTVVDAYGSGKRD